MELSARQIHEKQFHDAWRGYNQEEVDDFLDKVAEAMEHVQRENGQLQARVRELDQAVATSRDTEEMLKKTLVTAQQAAEEAISSAKAKAEQLIGEAEGRARRAEERSQERVAQMEAELRRRSEQADREHQARKRELEASIEKLRGFESELRHRLRSYLEQQLRALESLSPSATRYTTGEQTPQREMTPRPGTTAQRAQSLSSVPSEQPRPAGDGAPESREDTDPVRAIRLPPEEPERRGVRGLFGRNES